MPAARDNASVFEATFTTRCVLGRDALGRAAVHHGILALPDLQFAIMHYTEAAAVANCACMLARSRDLDRWDERRADARKLVARLQNDITALVSDCLRDASPR